MILWLQYAQNWEQLHATKEKTLEKAIFFNAFLLLEV